MYKAELIIKVTILKGIQDINLLEMINKPRRRKSI